MKRFILFGLLSAFLLMATHAFAEDVYVTQKGKKYHKEICLLIKNKNASKMDKKEALEAGYTPCKKCFKEDLPKDEQPNQDNQIKEKGKSK